MFLVWMLAVQGLSLLFIFAGASDIGDYDPVRCSSCWELQNCKILNGLSLPDPVVGYTRNATAHLEKQGVCEDMDASVTMLTVFGREYQYKDTAACRELVYKFNCLTWGAQHNACPNAPLNPCRSMCIEVADQCVFKHLYSIYVAQVCAKIPCNENNGTEYPCIPDSSIDMIEQEPKPSLTIHSTTVHFTKTI